jgi:DNA-directed RNA polymerase specialized sigma24 family protein
VNAFSHVDSFSGGTFYPWLGKIARNRCVNHLKSTAVIREGSGTEALETAAVQKDFAAEIELAEQIRQVLEDLAPEQRVSLKLCLERFLSGERHDHRLSFVQG